MKYLIVICLLLAGCGSQNQPVVMIIGDSISLGYTPYVQQELDGRYIIFHSEGNPELGQNDESSYYYLQHMDKWLEDAGPVDIIHANWGIWDILYSYRQSPNHLSEYEDEYRNDLEQVADRLDKTHARIIWATITPVPNGFHSDGDYRVRAFNKILMEVANEHKYQIDDLYSYMLPYQNLHISDTNVHYIPEGYQFLSYAVIQAIEN